ncbi:hypothetical protein CEUSTIGMA_g862.t1 [Chlamydomonas eustigma]|uniref:Ionotropic glutamate receptor C-terminal domain-containing protein n=1 Tax=Chlamydomonas eustigma TaxID=1157962 RepID=A0A250WS95_9CHLO|nr:hypothetical protein CEUSTIGMA_g862.t1 [Chlamydomonas eustigma]|eukprot:GAX73410.1 hypothetical protein CEUSTIGMA_g862.t1 [Chlamydomonas eustigma]
MISVLFGQILKWPYNVTWLDVGLNEWGYMIRKGINCDVGVQSFFISPSDSDLCNVLCPDLPSDWNASAHVDVDYIPYLCCIDFTYPYFTGGWSIMSQVNKNSATINYVQVFFQSDVVTTIAVSVICCFFTAHLIWLIERTQFGKSALLTNPKEGFNPKYLDGLRDGMWFASNTILNGIVCPEKTIITTLGRLVTSFWTLFGILATAYITSILSSTLTTNNLSGSLLLTAQDIAGLTVCMQHGFGSAFFANQFPGIGVQQVLLPTVFDCYPLVNNGSVQAVFDVREQSITWFQAGNASGLMISLVLAAQGYGMMMPKKWVYEDHLNEAILIWTTADANYSGLCRVTTQSRVVIDRLAFLL